MRIHNQDLADVTRYIESNRLHSLEEKEADFEARLNRIQQFKKIEPGARILEIGTGTGWFTLLCQARNIRCKGLEISPQLIDYSRQLGRAHGLQADIELGNIEEAHIGTAQYDVVIGESVFEHVEHWQKALQRVFDALKPGGVFFFSSTNKFSLGSGEYHFPLYGWLPNRWRYRLRMARQGPDIMKLGIDFNQFTHAQLRRVFRELGFSQVLDRVEAAELDGITNPCKRALLEACRRSALVKWVVLLFCDATIFVCVK